MMGCKSQLLISEESLAESVRKYWCLYDKSCADYKNKVFVEWAVVDKKVGFEKGKEFSYFLCIAWNVNIELANYFTNALALSDCKSLPTSKSICFIINTCRSTKILNVFVTVILKLENAMGPSGVPYHLFLRTVIWI